MYKAFFGFHKNPFASTLDPATFFRSSQHDAALKGLLLSVEARMGVVSLVGDKGTGKSMVLECLRGSLASDIPCAFVRDSRISLDRFLETIASDLNLDLRFKRKSAAHVFLTLTRLMTQQAHSGRTVVLIVDEAHDLPANVFEEIVHIAGLHHDKAKEIQTIFAGRPHLEQRLAALNPDKVKQRAILSRSLYPFTAQETQEYVKYRLACAGMPKQTIFPNEVLEDIYSQSQGFAPAINDLCERLLLTAFSTRSKVCDRHICDLAFEKTHRVPWRIAAEARMVLGPRIDTPHLAPVSTPQPPPLQTAFLRVPVDARLGSLHPRQVSTREWPHQPAAGHFKLVFPRSRVTLTYAELPLGSIRPMPLRDCAKAPLIKPSLGPGLAISSIPVCELFPRLPQDRETRICGTHLICKGNLIPSEHYLRLRPNLSGEPLHRAFISSAFSSAAQPRCPSTNLAAAAVVLCSPVPLRPIWSAAYDRAARTPTHADSHPVPFASLLRLIPPTANFHSASVIAYPRVSFAPLPIAKPAPFQPSRGLFVEADLVNLTPLAPILKAHASFQPSVWEISPLLPVPLTLRSSPPPIAVPTQTFVRARPSLEPRRPTSQLQPTEPPRPSQTPLIWEQANENARAPWESPVNRFIRIPKPLPKQRKPLLAFAAAIAAALAFYGAPPALRAATDASEQGWRRAQHAVLDRAAVAFDEDFRAGLSNWMNRSGSEPRWAADPSAFVRPRTLALYRPSLRMVDCELQFLGTIDKKDLSWVVRAADFNNYYVVRLTVLKPGPLPAIGVTRYAVINGIPEKRVTKALLIRAQADTVYRVHLDIRGDQFALSIQGQPVDSWSESRLTHGAIGFFSEKDAESRIAGLQLRGHDDMLGRICAFVMPSALSNHRGSE